MKKETEELIIFIILPEVLKMTKIRKSSLPKYMKEEGFPKPVPGTERTRFWVLSEVQEWMRDRIRKRDEALMGKSA